MEKAQRVVYSRQGGARLLTGVTTRMEGWGRKGGGQHVEVVDGMRGDSG